MNPLRLSTRPMNDKAVAAAGPTTRAMKTPFSPRLSFALATGLVVLAASLTPTARAMAPAEDHEAGHGQHHGQQHRSGHAHGHGDKGMGHTGMGHMGMDHMGMGAMGMGMGMMGRQSERLLDSVGASAEQKAQIRQIGEAARADIRAQREAGAGLRQQAQSLMLQPNIDARAVEAVRQQMQVQHDQASQRMTQAMVEMGRVLTPAQRQALAERMDKRQELMKAKRAERMAAPAR